MIESDGAGLAGYKDEDVIGTPGYNYLVLESPDDVPKEWNPDAPRETVFTNPVRVRSANGKTIKVHNHREAIINGKGMVVEYRGSSTPFSCCQKRSTSYNN